MLHPRYLIGFTGHRSGYDENLIRPAITQALTDLKARAAALGGRAELYASIAEGCDTLCVEIARDLDTAVHLLLPLPQDEFAKDFSSPELWERSRRQIALASQKPSRDTLRTVSGEMTRPDCYFNQGIQMLEAVDILVAVWDGEPACGLGGTAQMITHAQKLGLPVLVIEAKTGQSRIMGDLSWAFASDALLTELQHISQKAGTACANLPGTADDLQKCLDGIANTEAKLFRPSLLVIILLHGIAALLAAIVTFKVAEEFAKDSPWEHWKWVFTATELLLVSYALWLSTRLHREHTQERWIRCRFACELVRGLRASVPLIDPLCPSIGLHDPKWRRFALSVGLLVNERRATLQPLALRDHYISTRFSETNAEGQIGHFLKMRPKAMRWWKTTGFVSQWSAQLAPGFVLLSLINKVFHLGYQRLFGGWVVVTLLPIALPLLAGMASGIRQALDAGRRKERYAEMAARLTALRTHLTGLETLTTIARTVTQTEEILLDELREWQLTTTTTGH